MSSRFKTMVNSIINLLKLWFLLAMVHGQNYLTPLPFSITLRQIFGKNLLLTYYTTFNTFDFHELSPLGVLNTPLS
jgi:hypothetical protein